MRARVYMGEWFICDHCDERVMFRNTEQGELPQGVRCLCGASYLQSDLIYLAKRDLLARSMEFDCPSCRQRNIMIPHTRTLFHGEIDDMHVTLEHGWLDATRTACRRCNCPVELYV